MKLDDVQIVFADLQPSLVASSRTLRPDALGRSCAALAEAARVLGLPITFRLVPVDDDEGGPIPELRPYAHDADCFRRHGADLFLDPAIAATIDAYDRSTLVLAGFAAEVVVLHSALAALEAGYEVQVPLDAIGSRSARTEAAALRQIERAGGTLTSVASLLSALAPDFTRPPGALLLETLKMLDPGA